MPGSPDVANMHLQTSARLLESKIYIIRRNTLKGAFPVFVVDLDFSVILDNTTMTAIKGYIVDRKQ